MLNRTVSLFLYHMSPALVYFTRIVLWNGMKRETMAMTSEMTNR